MNANDIDTTDTLTWDLPARNLDLFVAKIDQANRKLRAAGIEGRFEVEYEDHYLEIQPTDEDLPEAPTTMEHRILATLAGPLSISSGHYVFAAALEQAPAGILVRTAPGIELGGYEPRGDQECDHCGLNRDRTRLYLVRDERDGSITQVGHTCLEAYTGISPKGLWILTLDEELERIATGGGTRREPEFVRLDDVIAMAWAVSDRGTNYVSTKMAEMRKHAPTGATVLRYLAWPPRPERHNREEYNRYVDAVRLASTLDAETRQAILQCAQVVDAYSDYGRNLRIVTADDQVTLKSVAMAASLVSVWARETQRRVEASNRTPAAAGYLDQVGQRVRGFSIELRTVRVFEGDYGYSTLLIGRTSDQHAVKWFRSGNHSDLNAGDRVNMKAATVKDHEEFNGDDVTVITRGLVASVDKKEAH